ncbi:MAG: hypothetical protein JHC98_04655 [Thermoleophilaceae bacterium]|nr:hypothetical protein [Thermoleophilaceae bacterium]
MRIPKNALGALICSLLAIALLPASGGAVTIGNNLSHAPDNSTCLAMATPVTCSASQDTLNAADQAAGGLVAPAGGVITRWRLRSAGATTFRAALKVLDGDHSIISESPQAVPTADGVHEFDTRLPIAAGNRIGVDIHNDSAGVMATVQVLYNTAAHDSLWDFWSPVLADDSTQAPANTIDDIGLLINADIEPDADADGYGDATQDLCSADATTHGACPGPKTIVPAVRPVISVLDIASGNKRIYVTTSGAAKLKLTFARKTAGRRSGGRCKSATSRGKRCSFYKLVGVKTADVAAGINSIPFAEKLSGKRLKPGSYRLTAVASTPDGGRSAARSISFRIR